MVKYILGLASLIVATPMFAATKYVDNTLIATCSGSTYSVTARTCSGTDGAGYKTIQEAENSAQPDDIINLRAGVYRERTLFQSNAGTAGHPITLQNYNNETVVIKFPEGAWQTKDQPLFGFGTTGAPAYWIFKGLEMDGERDTKCTGDCQTFGNYNYYFAFGNSDSSGHDSHPVEISNCTIHDFGHAGIKGAFDYTIHKNQIYDIGFDRRDHGLYLPSGKDNIMYNYIHDISGNGMQLYSGPFTGPVVISYNIIRNYGLVDPTDRYGILVAANNAVITNNLVSNGPYGIFLWAAVEGLTVKNNIFLNNTVADIGCVSQMAGPNSVFENNIYGDATICVGCTQPNTEHFDDVPPNTTTIPLFVGGAAPSGYFDYRLAAGSSAIDEGVIVAGVSTAIDPTVTTWPPSTMPQTAVWEIGPFAYVLNHRYLPFSAQGRLIRAPQ